MKRGGFYFGLIVSLAIAGAIGFFLGRRSSVETRRWETVRVSAKGAETTPPIENRNIVTEPLPIAAIAAESKSSQRLARLQALTDLNRLLANKISVPMILGEDLNKDFVALFGLSPVEVKNLNDAIAKAKAQVADLESNYARIESRGSEKFTVTIPIFPKEGGLVLDEFLTTVRSNLGGERYDYYSSISRFEAENNTAFGMFGLSQTVINIEEMRDANEMPTANSSMHFDQASGGMIKTVNTGLNFLKVQYPVIYQKLVDSGAIAPASNE